MKNNLTRSTLAGLTALWLVALSLVAQSPAPAGRPGATVLCGPTEGLPPGTPIAAIAAHLCGFHFYSGEPTRTVRVEHYCSHASGEIQQCVVYDSDRKDARLIGVEYIITEALFIGLPEEEKKLWHSHRYEVSSGLLNAPGLSPAAEKAVMAGFASTYGKTWTLWQTDRGDKVPLGLPKLMMGFTADGQIDAAVVAARDREQNYDSAAAKAQRADLPFRPVAPGADAWQNGGAFQIDDALLHAPPPPKKP